MVEVMVSTGAVRHAKLQSIRHHQDTTLSFLQAVFFVCPANSIRGLEESPVTVM